MRLPPPSAGSVSDRWRRSGAACVRCGRASPTARSTVVSPGVLSPASSTADLTCADGTGRRYSIGIGSCRSGHGERQAGALAGQKLRAKAAQRLGDAAHRPASQRGVAGDERGQRMGREDAEQQSRRGPGIAEVEQILRLGKTADPDPVDSPAAIVGARRMGAERIHRRRGGEHILAFEQAGDLGPADRQRAQHQRAMRDRLVARHADFARERGRGTRRVSGAGGGSGKTNGPWRPMQTLRNNEVDGCGRGRRRPICGSRRRCLTADMFLTGRRPCGNGAPTDPDETRWSLNVAKPEWGTKRICPSCGTRYYDLLHGPVICPKCATPFDPEAFLKSRRARPVAPVEKELEPVGAEELETDAETEEEADVAGKKRRRCRSRRPRRKTRNCSRMPPNSAKTMTTWPRSSRTSRRRNPDVRRAGSGAFFACPRRAGFLAFARRTPWPATADLTGAIAQLGERYNGIVEVTGSIPVGSTK